MSKVGKALLVLSGLALILGGLGRFLFADRPELLWIPFAVAGLFLLVEAILDFKLYREFLGLKTTKHGMNMGVMIILVLVLVTAVNFVAVRKNKKWDMTSEKLNSLSEQTVKLLKGLDSDLTAMAFLREDNGEEEQVKFMLKSTLSLLQDETPKLKFEVVNAIKRPDLVKENNISESPVLLCKYKGKSTTITDFSEEAIANAIVKVTRDKNKIIYYLSGHGEVDLEDAKAGGGLFKKSLQDTSYDLRKLSLIVSPKVPDDADVVLLLGPHQALLEPELTALEDYARRGGNLFFAIDPGQRQNLSPLMLKLGVVYDDNYIIDQVGQLVGQSAAVAIGMEYSKSSEITKPFTNQITAFEMASSLSRDPKATGALQYDELVKSSPASFAKREISGKVSFDEGKDKKGPLVVAVSVSGTLAGKVATATKKVGDKAAESEKASEGKRYSAIVVGDSDFLSGRLLPIQLNRDLALNSIAFLAKDAELISIKPKQLATTKISMTQTQAGLLVFGVYLPIPILLLVLSGAIWFRRRGA